MQATVFTFDAESRSGSVVTDAGMTLTFDTDAFDAGGLRLVRPGQRVRLALSAEGRVDALTVSTLDRPPDARRDRT